MLPAPACLTGGHAAPRPFTPVHCGMCCGDSPWDQDKHPSGTSEHPSSPGRGSWGLPALTGGEIEERGGEGKAATPGEGGGGGRAQVLVVWGEKKGKRGKMGKCGRKRGRLWGKWGRNGGEGRNKGMDKGQRAAPAPSLGWQHHGCCACLCRGGLGVVPLGC